MSQTARTQKDGASACGALHICTPQNTATNPSNFLHTIVTGDDFIPLLQCLHRAFATKRDIIVPGVKQGVTAVCASCA